LHDPSRAGVRKRAPALLLRVLPVALLLAGCAAGPVAPSALRFSAPEGRALNEFYRRGPVAAHLVLTPGTKPRMVIAFPAGNSGTAVWFDASAGALSWSNDVRLESAQLLLADGGTLHGVTAEIEARGTPLSIRQAIVGSVRVIRDYEYGNELPSDALPPPEVAGNSILLQRRRLDGGAGYYLSIELTTGSVARERERIVLAPDANGRLSMRVTALTGDTPLTPIGEERLLTADAAPDTRLRRMLTFLSYEEKLLAGSWRFDTYFGRDTLMSVRLLAPVLQPAVMEAGLASVLERLNAAGEVAHEEDIGEFAILRRRAAGLPPDDVPVFDYKMIDDDFMLPVVAAHYLLDMPAGRERAGTFLATRTASGELYGKSLVRNAQFLLRSTEPFAREPRWTNLVSLKPGVNVGNWRDSEDGLGGGRYPYDVNGALAPAALQAIARLHASGLLRPHVDAAAEEALAKAAGMAEVWHREAPRLFDVVIVEDEARAEVEAYARRVGVDPAEALRAIDEPVRFRAVSLDTEGRPVRVLNSDEGFALLFVDAPSEDVARVADNLTRPFPAGLLTGVGLTVANPAYAPDSIEPVFDRGRYHGAVIWSWQQALLAAGIERQLQRQDLTAGARTALERARARLDEAIQASDAVRGSELWSWSQANGGYRVEPFGQRQEDETESNAAQLWSTVWLALGVGH
jgi:hypothetical protein